MLRDRLLVAEGASVPDSDSWSSSSRPVRADSSSNTRIDRVVNGASPEATVAVSARLAAVAASAVGGPLGAPSHEGAPTYTSLDEVQWRALRRLQRWWRAVLTARVVRSLGASWAVPRPSGRWRGRSGRRLGDLGAHAHYLQWLFRSTRRLRQGCWRRGMMPRWLPVLVLRLLRRAPRTACGGGARLAEEAQFEAQRRLAAEMLDWYGVYVAILRRLRSGDVPSILQGFCGGGGSSEGARRAGVDGFGVDICEQTDYVRRFGADSFLAADATSWAATARLKKQHAFVGAMYSPPCQVYSRLRRRGVARSPALIELTRDAAREFFDLWAIENVMGAASHMSEHAVELDGAYFGLRVFRSRLIESSFELIIDRCVRAPADALRARCCMGERRRWRRRDEFGRPLLRECCDGNMFAPLGTHPLRCTAAECSAAMGVDVDHMSYERLAQSIPPDYGQLVASQMCMRAAERLFGVPVISFDEMRLRPQWARATLARWVRGAGDDRVHAGLSLVCGPAIPDASGLASGSASGSASGLLTGRHVGLHGAHEVIPSRGTCDAERRELYYSYAGDYDQCWRAEGVLATAASFGHCAAMVAPVFPTSLVGHNTYLEGDWRDVEQMLAGLDSAPIGTRVTVVVEAAAEMPLLALGFEGLPCVLRYGEADTLAARGLVAMCWGRRSCRRDLPRIIHEDLKPFMDERDRLGIKADAEAKAELAESYLIWEPERWVGAGFDERTTKAMTEGVRVEADAATGAYAVPQYAFPDAASLAHAIHEADRALAAGHMSYVPDAEIESVLASGVIHPWLMVQQGEKWRLCQDYSDGTNRVARTAPFGLPCVWDAAKVVGPGSHFAKYDLRDGFWSVPVCWESRRFLVMRHPSTGRLMWCDRLPFGYLDSPRQFCYVTEAVAQMFRRRMAGRGIHIFCYCDDYLIIGDDEARTVAGMHAFESLLAELGLCWAPHKQRGPCRVLEFLGLLLVNTPSLSAVGLTESRQAKVSEMLENWAARRPAPRCAPLAVEPKELAKLLGHLVFASQCVPGGRTYMQGMLSQFTGLEVDWRHGAVRPVGAARWSALSLDEGFWRDLDWWRDHLAWRNCVPIHQKTRADAAIVTGTDSSDWGTGQLMWLDGQLEEMSLEFTASERRRPINWRELLGILRAVELAGERARGCLVLVETDSMAAKGAADKLASRAADMQELLRRLLERLERWGVSIRLTHTPGAKLWRPDQTSRGEPLREPRLRLTCDAFALMTARFGGFGEWLGSERRHDSASVVGDGVWMHPSYECVGSALRCLGQRLDGETRPIRGLVVVPHDESAAWWQLTRHFTTVGRWEPGSRHLEMCQLGRWTGIAARRAAIVLSFPRSVGSVVRPVLWRAGVSADGYVRVGRAAAGGSLRALPLLEGSYVYQPGVAGSRGVLYRVWAAFAPGTLATASEEAGRPAGSAYATPSDAYLLGAELLDVGRGRFELSLRQFSSRGESGSFAPVGRLVPWQQAASQVWTVDHLVRARAPSTAHRSLASGKARQRSTAEHAAELSYDFDRAAAEREIARALRQIEEAARREASDPPPRQSAARPQIAAAEDAAAPRATRSRGADVQLLALPEGGTAADAARRLAAAEAAEVVAAAATTGAAPPANAEGGPAPDGAAGISPEGGAGEEDERADADELCQLADDAAALDLDEAQDAEAELLRARAHAVEAALLRMRPAAARPDRAPTGPPAPAGRPPVQRCRYVGQTCEGCGLGFRFMEKVLPGVRSFVHERGEGKCLELARAAAAERERQRRGAAAATQGADLSVRQAQFSARLSDKRLADARRCLDGRCGVLGEERVFCLRGCGRGVHLVGCLGTSEYYRAAGRLICTACRLFEIMARRSDAEASDSLLRMTLISMVTELTAGAVSTAAGRSQFSRLEERWLEAQGGVSAAALTLPRDNVESFINFMWWLVTDAGRARSFATVMRAAGAVMTMTERVDWTKTARVKATVREIEKVCAVEPVPCTHTTTALLRILLSRVVPMIGRRVSARLARLLRARTLMLLVLELLCGMRVGEATSSGDDHGLAANDCCLQTPHSEAKDDGLGTTFEGRIRDSKTGPGRFVACVGLTRGPLALNAEAIVRDYLEECGVSLEGAVEGGMQIERPNYYVVRVSGSQELLRRVAAAAPESSCADVRVQANSIHYYAGLRGGAKTLDETARYVNIAGGTRLGAEIVAAWAWVKARGWGDHASIVPGPLVRATNGNTLTHMPLDVKSTYTHLVKGIESAYEIMKDENIVDPDLDLAGQVEPTWGNHSLRRHADELAQRALRDSYSLMEGVTTKMINVFFGWCLKEIITDMQMHYAGLDRPARRTLARVTLWM